MQAFRRLWMPSSSTASTASQCVVVGRQPVSLDACEQCTQPCQRHPAVPESVLAQLSQDPLTNTVKPYRKHVLVGVDTAAHTWPSHVERDQPWIALIKKHLPELEAACHGKVLLTAVEVGGTGNAFLQAGDVVVMPDGWRFPGLMMADPGHLDTWSGGLVNGWATAAKSPPHPGVHWDSQHFLVLVCAHANRDRRCGTIGPLMVEALRHEVATVLVTEDAGVQASVFACSHVGGHAFAGNVLIYPEGVWYGRVRPCHAGPLVQRHLLGAGYLVELFRGRLSLNKDQPSAS